jgi:hypothetical protein
MTLGRRNTIDDGLSVGASYVKSANPRYKIKILALTAEAMTYVVTEPPADAIANPNHLTVHRPTFARQVREGFWVEVTS